MAVTNKLDEEEVVKKFVDSENELTFFPVFDAGLNVRSNCYLERIKSPANKKVYKLNVN